MNELEEAKTILENHRLSYSPSLNPRLAHAHQLGLEALTYIIHLRAFSLQHRQAQLPSEGAIIDTSRSPHTIKKILESPLGREPKG